MTSLILGIHMETLRRELTTPHKMGGLHFSLSTEHSKVKMKRTGLIRKTCVSALAG